MRVYLKGVAVGVALLTVVLLVYLHASHHRAQNAEASERAVGGGPPQSRGRAAGGATSGQRSRSRDEHFTEELDIRDVDPVAATEPRQQEELDKKQFEFEPVRGRPKPPEKISTDSQTWLKDMNYPSWYLESVKRSTVFGKENNFVGDKPLFAGPCPGADKVKEMFKKRKELTFGFVELGKLLPQCKNPCWYDDPKTKKSLMCVPYFYVAGVAKCGTTDLYRRLRYHPEIMVGMLKEYHWWDRLRYGVPMELKFTEDSQKNDSPLPLSTYSEVIMGDEVDDLKNDLKTRGSSVRICGDGSPSYLWDPSQWPIYEGNEGCTEPRIITGSFIKYATPETKIFLIFRHPTPRLYSRFLSRIPRYPPFKDATPQMFHDFVVKGVACYKRCFKEHSIRECVYNATLYDEAVIRLVEGMYSVFLEDWLRIFRRDQIMVFRNEDYSEQIEVTVRKAFHFLGVSEISRDEWKPILTHYTTNIGSFYETVGDMLPETIEVLNEFYKPFVLRTYELLGDEKYLWKDILVK